MEITPDKNRALFLAKKQVTALVYNTVQLEGINYTLPEVQTLLDGVTVGGHTLHEQEITINQYKSWCKLFDLVTENKFSLTKETACKLHKVAGKNEALKWGVFRNGGVSICGTEDSYNFLTTYIKAIKYKILSSSLLNILFIYDHKFYIKVSFDSQKYYYYY